MRSQLGWRTWVSLACVFPLCNIRSRGADDIPTTVTNPVVSAAIISTRLIVVVFHVPLGHLPVMLTPVTGHMGGIEKVLVMPKSTGNGQKLSVVPDSSDGFRFPINPIKCENVDNMK